jgi:hypothetical protein
LPSTITQPAPLDDFERHLESVRSITLPRDTSDARHRFVTRENGLRGLNVSPHRKASSQAGLPFIPWTLQTLGPIRFLSQLQAWLMSQFIVHADAASCSARRRRRDTRELVPPCSRVYPNPSEHFAHLIKRTRPAEKQLRYSD